MDTKALEHDASVLEALRKLSETEIHKRVIHPLLVARGATHIRYTHGPAERGKDFVYLAPGFWGKHRLTVCIVKNEPFTGRASASGNTVSTLTQLQQCKTFEVLNPSSNQKEMPESVVLITMYPVPDKDVADASPLLYGLRSSGCEVIAPEEFVAQVREGIPAVYAELLAPGGGGMGQLERYLAVHREARAFDVMGGRDRFFVNIGILQEDIDLNAIDRTAIARRTWRVEVPYVSAEELQLMQRCIQSLAQCDQVVTVPQSVVQSQAVTAEIHGVRMKKCLSALASRVASATRQTQSATGAYGGVSVVQEVVRATAFLRSVLAIKAPTVSSSDDEVEEEEGGVADTRFSLAEIAPKDILDGVDSMCIVGTAGAGKTSLVTAIAKEAIHRGLRTVYFPCQALDPSDPIQGAIEGFMQQFAPDSPDYGKECLTQAQLIIIDGCDEAPGFGVDLGNHVKKLILRKRVTVSLDGSAKPTIPPSLADRIEIRASQKKLAVLEPLSALDVDLLQKANPSGSAKTAISHLVNEYKAVARRVIVTSRSAEELALHPSIATFRILPFSDEQLEEFFRRWFGGKASSAKGIIAFLNKNTRIREVCRLPIVASIVAALHENGLALPRSRTEVYDTYFDLMLDRWDRSRNVRSRNRVSSTDKRMLLRRLAWNLHRSHRRQFGVDELAKLWSNRLADRYRGLQPADVLSELKLSNSVVHELAPNEYSLGHLSFQEFLAAEGAIFGDHRQHLVENFDDPWWEQVIIFYAGKKGDVDRFLSDVHASHSVTTGRSNLFNEILSEARFTPGIVRDVMAEMLDDESQNDSSFDEQADLEAFRENDDRLLQDD